MGLLTLRWSTTLCVGIVKHNIPVLREIQNWCKVALLVPNHLWPKGNHSIFHLSVLSALEKRSKISRNRFSSVIQYIMESSLAHRHILPDKINLMLVYLSRQKCPFLYRGKMGIREFASASLLIPTNFKVISIHFPFLLSVRSATITSK